MRATGRQGSHHVTEDQKKKEGEQVPQAWPKSYHPVSGGCKEARGQDTHGNQIKQNCGCEIGWSAVHPTCSLPAVNSKHRLQCNNHNCTCDARMQNMKPKLWQNTIFQCSSTRSF